jgi:hypothetical protein
MYDYQPSMMLPLNRPLQAERVWPSGIFSAFSATGGILRVSRKLRAMMRSVPGRFFFQSAGNMWLPRNKPTVFGYTVSGVFQTESLGGQVTSGELVGVELLCCPL